jgi:hypothetical protein
VFSATVRLTDKEHSLLNKAALLRDSPLHVVLKYWIRMGQLVDAKLSEGENLRFRRATGEIYDPFEILKMVSKDV